MKAPFPIATLMLLLFMFAPAVLGQGTCTCTAPDNKCAPRVRCPHGCTALCGSHDACYAGCGSIEADKSYARITLKIDNKNSETIAASLTRHTGRIIKFIPRKKSELFSVDLNNDPAWKALRFLNKRGTILVDGTPFDRLENLRHKTLRGEKVSVNFTGVSVRNALAKLSFVTGLPFYVESGDAEQFLSISLERVTLSEIVSHISAQTSVRIVRTDKRPSKN